MAPELLVNRDSIPAASKPTKESDVYAFASLMIQVSQQSRCSCRSSHLETMADIYRAVAVRWHSWCCSDSEGCGQRGSNSTYGARGHPKGTERSHMGTHDWLLEIRTQESTKYGGGNMEIAMGGRSTVRATGGERAEMHQIWMLLASPVASMIYLP